ncbi:cell wall-active antibiotics response protein LiaF [Bacillus spongiae]|uniref:Cell wall-active antibiotics response protein LiaF n=1 Tax=Bacillus spongiae TaxID=2683610 RepID=A0ABU8HB00_9BACI
MNKQSIMQAFFLIFLLFIGIVLLLLNVGVISLEIGEVIVELIPYAITLTGLSFLVKSFVRKSSGRLFLGILLTTYGGLIILNSYDLVSFSYTDLLNLWPVLIIFIAIKGIFFRGNNINEADFHKKRVDLTDIDDEVFQKKIKKIKKSKPLPNQHSAFIGDMRFSENNWSVEPMTLSHFIGDVFVDFGKAFIPDGETPINVSHWIGDIKILIPEDVGVEIYAKVNIGDIKLLNLKSNDIKPTMHYRSPDYESAVKKVKLILSLNIGSIRVDKV